jgi:aryl-alcohol dehydrogenase-like predicted oxidoreductase
VEFRRLGGSGLMVSVIGLGTNTFGRYADEAETTRIIHQALDLGINLLDTADTYPRTPRYGLTEELIGTVIKGRRSDVLIATKVSSRVGTSPNDHGSSRGRIMDGVEASLRRLQTDYIDLYSLHHWDAWTPLEESLRALDDLVRQGKVRYVGCSNFTAAQTVTALWIADRRGYLPMVANSPQYSLLERSAERELIPACLEYGLGLVPYSPLAGGMLTGKYREGEPIPAGTRGVDNSRLRERFTPEGFGVVRRLQEWAEARDHTIAELAIAWLAAQPVMASVIAGASRAEQVQQNVRAADWKLSADDLRALDELSGWSSSPDALRPYIHPEAPRK